MCCPWSRFVQRGKGFYFRLARTSVLWDSCSVAPRRRHRFPRGGVKLGGRNQQLVGALGRFVEVKETTPCRPLAVGRGVSYRWPGGSRATGRLRGRGDWRVRGRRGSVVAGGLGLVMMMLLLRLCLWLLLVGVVCGRQGGPSCLRPLGGESAGERGGALRDGRSAKVGRRYALCRRFS